MRETRGTLRRLRAVGRTGRWLLCLAVTGSVAAVGSAVAFGGGVLDAGAATTPFGGCPTVDIIVARASTELPGTGIIGSLAAMVKGQIHSSVRISPVAYPALLAPYAPSTDAGDRAIKAQLTQEVQSCPDTKIVLMGYSQGAQLVGDALAGGGGVLGLGAINPPVPQDVSSHVVAGIQMGDPRHMPFLSFDKGTAYALTGLFPRLPSQSLAPFSNILQSYCDIGDPFCTLGGLDVFTHLSYCIVYNGAADQFVVSKLHAAGVQ